MARSGTDFDACIEALKGAGLASDVSLNKIARELKSKVDSHREAYRKYDTTMGEEELNKKAHEMAIIEMQGRFKELRQQEVINIKARLSLTDDLKNPAHSVSAELMKMIQHTRASQIGISAELINRNLQGFVDKFKGLPFGIDELFTKNRPLLDDVVRAGYGVQKVNPMAAEFMNGIKNVYAEINKIFAHFGVDLKWDTENFIFPQKYSYVRVSQVGREEFVHDFSKINLDKLNKARGGKEINTNAELHDYLASTYDDMMLDLKGSGGTEVRTSKSIMDKMNEVNRKFHFDDPNDFLFIHNKYGEGNIYSNIIDHISQLSQQIAIFRRFGADPDANFRYVNELANADMKKRVAEGRGYKAIADPAVSLEKQWNNLTGKVNQMVPGKMNKVATETMSTVNSLALAKALGKVVIAALLDLPNHQMMAGLYGARFKEVFGNDLKNIANEFAAMVGKESDRMKLKRRASLALEDLGTYARQSGRFGEQMTFGKISKGSGALVDSVMRMTFAIGLQKSLKNSHYQIISAHIADEAGLPFSKLSDNTKLTFKRYGITEKDWLTISSSTKDIIEDGKVVDTVIDAKKILDYSPDTYIKWNAMLYEEGRLAVREPSVETQAIMNQGLKAGHPLRILTQPLFTLKSFAITQTLDGLRTLLFDPRITNRYTWGGKMALYMIMMGGLVNVINALADKREIPPINSVEFLGNAIQRASLLGIGQDVLLMSQFADMDKNKKGGTELTRQLLGPTYNFLFEGLQTGASLVSNEIGGKPKEKARARYDALNFIDRNHPGANIFYRKMFEKMNFIDDLKGITDPKRAAKEKQARERINKRIAGGK